MAQSRKVRSDILVGNLEKKLGLEPGAIRNPDGSDARSNKKLATLRKEFSKAKGIKVKTNPSISNKSLAKASKAINAIAGLTTKVASNTKSATAKVVPRTTAKKPVRASKTVIKSKPEGSTKSVTKPKPAGTTKSITQTKSTAATKPIISKPRTTKSPKKNG
ncbi:hypothetical protein [Mucilaginibacter flavus]|uniref:hypothetical protein n=1 Tax=Mucilaginibacter flavus TaxID=931504 RepID=UPI0025B51E9C|nr:hypothetical protein [Mucilaginibacter flavus]MDN3580370.1 hypothetical protein [Mucilaginibacter flavus]